MNRRATLAAVIGLIAMPVVVAAVEAFTYFAANRSDHTIVSSGLTREYILHVPPTYHRGTPTPLVISMHGAGMWPAAQQDTSQWNRVADREGFLVVYPSGLGGNGLRIWEAVAGGELQRDSRFIADLIDSLKQSHTIDPARIYANGLSNGGGMSFALSCTMPDRIAAVGVVASAQLLPWGSCADAPPLPMIAFHGTDDGAAPYDGGRSWVSPRGGRAFPNIEEWTAIWARRNHCDPVAAESRIANDVIRVAFPGCPAAPVVLYRIEGGGHTWPGGGDLPEWFAGTTTQSIDASSVMWDFFKAHPRPPGTP